MFWSLLIGILSIKIFKISYFHKYWCFLSNSKMQKLSTCWAKEAWRDSRKHWQSFGVCCGCSNGLWCFGSCYCHIVNKNFQNIISPQVLMIFEHSKMQQLSTCWAREAWWELLESIDRVLGMLWLLKWVVMFWSLLLPYCQYKFSKYHLSTSIDAFWAF